MKVNNSKKAVLCFLLAAFCLAFNISPANAKPTMRGFQVSLGEINEQLVADLATTWKVNLVRVQVGDNGRMDGTTGQAYVDMMEEIFDLLDQALPLFAAHNMKVVFALYSPPGGFETRTGPAHYAMFSQAGLQDEFVDMWLRIMARYKDNPTIYAFDLVNEPALRKELKGAGVGDWNDLLLRTITAIRTVAPSVTLMIKSLYGDPSKLVSLPPIKDANIIYSYHPYVYGSYQHSGIAGTSSSIPRPSYAKTRTKLLTYLAKFTARMKEYKKQKKISVFPPRINAGEIAVSNCAVESAVYFNDLLSIIESDKVSVSKKDKRKARIAAAKAKKPNKKPNKPKPNKPETPAKVGFEQFINKVEHESYTIHSFAEAEVWDPRYICTGVEQYQFSGNSTDRALVIQSYLSRN